MKISINKVLMSALLVVGSVIAFSSCSDEWDDHYSTNASSLSGGTLWEALLANKEYSDFVDTLKAHNYQKLLSGTRVYTVFAPTNDAMRSATIKGTNVTQEFIKNQIAYFYHNFDATKDTTVTMLNKKVMRLLGNNFGDKLDPNIPVSNENTVGCSNGLLQQLPSILPYSDNLWEYIGKQSGTQFRDYLYSFNTKYLSETESTVDSINEAGQTVYLDSVTIDYNPLWAYVGSLSKEDSTYLTFVLDDTAWGVAYNRIAANYKYDEKAQVSGSDRFYSTADSLVKLREAKIKENIVADLSFRKATIDNMWDDNEYDWINSTGYNYVRSGVIGQTRHVKKATVKKWMDESQEITLSNGKAYRTSDFIYQPQDSWQDTIKIEGENSYTLQKIGTGMSTSTPRNTSDTLHVVVNGKDTVYKVSSNQYLYVAHDPNRTAATATFGIPNTLSGTYDVYVTFIPPAAVSGVSAKPGSVKGSLKYILGVLSNAPQIKSYTIPTFTTDANLVTRQYITTITLGLCYDGFLASDDKLYTETTSGTTTTKTELTLGGKYGVQLILQNATTARNSDYDHNLYIDCIELVPHRD